MADKDPSAFEDSLHFGFEDFSFGIDFPMDPLSLDEILEIQLRRHGFLVCNRAWASLSIPIIKPGYRTHNCDRRRAQLIAASLSTIRACFRGCIFYTLMATIGPKLPSIQA